MNKNDLALDDDIETIIEPELANHQDTAIRVLGLYKRYRHNNRSKIVLNGLNLNCQAGKLYILYGTGKSGKTALLKSILNIESYSRGAVVIFNKTVENFHGDVGYMPQKVGLDKDLTVIENINYFAGLQRLNKHECLIEFSSMQSPLTINEYGTFVKNLTEDQRKVLSFYIAIMASPKMVILDQPVAGCDPIHKRFFWQKMRQMVDNEGTTILMTCSDEIDVKYGDIVGYLRNGQIIFEEQPSELMKRYNIWNFNDLVLSISIAELKEFQIVKAKKLQTKDNVSIKSGGFDVTHFTSFDNLEGDENEKIMFDSSFTESHSNRNCCIDKEQILLILHQLWVLTKWQAVLSVRNYVKVIFYLLLPALCVSFYGYSVGNDMTEVNLGLVFCGNESYQCGGVDEPPICELERRISTKYLTKKPYRSYEEAEKDEESGILDAILLLNKYSVGMTKGQKEYGCESKAFATSNVVLEVDASSKLIRSHIIDQLSRAYGGSKDNPLVKVVTFSQSLNMNKEKCLAECPVTPFVSNLKHPNTGRFESEVMQLIWGAVAVVSHFSGALLGALPLCTQNQNGLMDRMEMIEVTHYKLQIVHWFTRTLFILVQNLLLLVTAITFLNITFTAYGIFSGWLATLLHTLCGFSFGILLFAILKKQVSIVLSLIVLELIVSALSGFLWNYHGLTQLFQKLTIVLPHHAVSKLLFEVIIHESAVTLHNIWVGFVSPLFWMLSTFVIYCVYSQSNK